jgi:hypothetical protein
VALLLMVVSLALSLREIQVSVDALNLRLSDIEELSERQRTDRSGLNDTGAHR